MCMHTRLSARTAFWSQSHFYLSLSLIRSPAEVACVSVNECVCASSYPRHDAFTYVILLFNLCTIAHVLCRGTCVSVCVMYPRCLHMYVWQLMHISSYVSFFVYTCRRGLVFSNTLVYFYFYFISWGRFQCICVHVCFFRYTTAHPRTHKLTPGTHTRTFKHTHIKRNFRTQHGLLPAHLHFLGRPLFMPLYKYFRQFGGVYKLSFAPVPQATFYVLSGVL